MLTFEDCLALCDLSEEEVIAIAEHEHIPEMAAIEFGEYLVHTPDGEVQIKQIIVEDIEKSKARGNLKHAKDLEAVLKHFVLTHPKLKGLIKDQVQ